MISGPLRNLAIPIDSLSEDPANARLHPDRNLEAIKASLRRFGQQKPIVVRKDTMTVVAGNGTLRAARSLGWKEVAAAVVGMDNAQAAAYAIADNRAGDLAAWDGEALARLLEATDVPVEDLGFSAEELEELLAEVNGQDPAEDPGAVDPPEDPVSERGKVYDLGPHRVMCGDSTNAEDVELLLGGAKPNLMVTDPPYGVSYDPAWRQEAAESGHLLYAAKRIGKVTNDDRADWREAWGLAPASVVYSWAPDGAKLRDHMEALVGFEIRNCIIWSKPHFPISRGHYRVRHEPCLYAVRKGKTANWIGGRKQTTVWEISLDRNVEGGHSTQKPLECMERPIRNHEGDVYDPFLGSGTTLIAAARQGRTCYGMEISPAYVDVIRKRWGRWAREARQDPGSGALD